MKIGDQVRFLSETGGGKVAGFQGKNIVLVEDEDGFEIPMQINDVVVVGNEDYSTLHVVENKVQTKEKQNDDELDTRSIKERLRANQRIDIEEPDSDPSDGYVPKIEERKGGDLLSVYIAFVPIDVHNMTNTRFEAYIVNDCNYYIHYSYLSAEGASWHVRSVGEVEPNTKEFMEEFGRDSLNEMMHACVQLIAYKREKNFMLKPSVDVQFRIDPVKFYKLHTFQENDFFETPALVYPIIENDVPTRPLVIDAKQLKSELYRKDGVGEKATASTKTAARRNELVRRYEKSQSKSRPINQRLKDDKIIVDLHADALLETTVGMSAADILDYQLDVFRKTLEQYKSKKGQKLIFIHGKGEGVLRQSVIHELNYKYKQYPYQDASFQEYGYGATQVTIK